MGIVLFIIGGFVLIWICVQIGDFIGFVFRKTSISYIHERKREKMRQKEIELQDLERKKKMEEMARERKEKDRAYAIKTGSEDWFENEYNETVDGKKLYPEN